METATVEFEIPDSPDSTESTVVGETIFFIEIAHDDSAENPLDSWDGVGKIYSLNTRHNNFVDLEELERIMKVNPDCVPLSYYEHSGSMWFVKDSPTRAGVEFQWDGRRFAGIWVPDDSVRDSYTGQDGLSREEWMREQAKSACEVYSDWCNGYVYGYVVTRYALKLDEDGDAITDEDEYKLEETLSDESCWGFYGWEYVISEAKAAAEHMVKE